MVLALLLLGACTDDPSAPGALVGADTTGDGGNAVLDVLIPDVPPPDDGPGNDGGVDSGLPPMDTAMDSAADASEDPDVGVDCSATPGAPTCPCETAADCDTGLCVLASTGRECATFCVESCPEGYSCQALTVGAGADTSLGCVPRAPYLCMPCESNADCATVGFEGADACVDYGAEGRFCGISCAGDDDCPSGYQCSAEGQCVSETGQCSCAPLHIELEASTACQTTNQHGSCEGGRACAPGGLQPCDAPAATAEICDGQDNDCNGHADDIGVIQCDIDNDFGTCQGTVLCQGGTSTCQGTPPSPDLCDGLDNDCDGSTDTGFPNQDGDPLANCVDPDDDNDGYADDEDICPLHADPDQVDTDGDTKGDACDADDDDDGTVDTKDCEPQVAIAYPFAPELCDGLDNDCDGATDEKSCDDSDLCTDDVCHPTEGCEHLYNEKPCNDENPCTTGDKCQLGSCEGQFLGCDDGNPCTDDGCTVGLGCTHTNNAAPCTDGNPCTDGDTCGSGSCLPGPFLDCDDENPCTVTWCDPQSGCVTELPGNPCDDGDACTVQDTCAGPSCAGSPETCDDGDECTQDACDSTTGCVFTPLTGADCDDGLPCTVDDACVEGTCTGDDASCQCATDLDCQDDGNLCNGVPFCDTAALPYVCRTKPGSVITCTLPDGASADCNVASCHADTGTCAVTPVDGTPACSDGDACTTGDACAGGQCVGQPQTCADGNPCTLDSCDQALGCVFEPTTGVVTCDDGDACTKNDACSGGFCQGTAPITCSDGNPCTNDLCDPDSGCVHQPNTVLCDDGSACTDGDRCAGGDCVPGAPVTCDDGNACNGTETCSVATGCVPGFPLLCDDGVPCTADSCAPASGCRHLPNSASCDDGALCNGLEQCDLDLGCVAEPAPNGTPCDDGQLCTGSDACLGGQCAGAPVSCDDGDPCTIDQCEEGEGCVYTFGTAPCDDGDPCTEADTCATGNCAGEPIDCSELDDACNDGQCDEGFCYAVPKTGTSCNDDDACTMNDACSAGGACAGDPMDCTDLDGPCAVGVCAAGVCSAEAIPCGIAGFRVKLTSGGVAGSASGQHGFQGALGQSQPTGGGSGGSFGLWFGLHLPKDVE